MSLVNTELLLLLLTMSFYLVATSTVNTEGASVLLVAPPAMGHIIPLLRLGEALVNRGHKVGFCTTEIAGVNVTQEGCQQHGLQFISAGPDPYTWEDYREFTNTARGMFTLQSTLMAQWIGAQSQKQIVDFLDSAKFRDWDVAVFDFMLEIGGMYLADKWGVVVIFNSVTLSFTPMLLPQWPFPVLGSQFDENMTFGQRFMNSLILPLVHAVKLSVVLRNVAVLGTQRSPLVTEVLYNGAAVGYPLLINSVIGFEFPRSRPSAVIHYTGPLIPNESNSSTISLPIWNWLNSKTMSSDVIFISMGSTAHLTHDMAKSIIESVQQTNHSAIWSLGASEHSILEGIEFNATQIFVVKWMPQKKVLSHPSIKVAMLHGGLGGIQEALLSQVPIICLPQMFDQWDNAARIKFHNLGVAIDPQTLSTTVLVTAIRTITKNYSLYKNAVIHICKLFKAAGGLERASQFVELYRDLGYSTIKNHLVQKKELLSLNKYLMFKVTIVVAVIKIIKSYMPHAHIHFYG